MTFHKIRSIVSKTSAAFLFCAAALFAQTPSFVTFDAPDAGTGDFQGTVGACINSAGAIGGSYTDSNNRVHGFVRNPSGVITEFEVPQVFGNPVAVAINSRGDVVGLGNNRAGFQGFLRTANGHIVQITPPGALDSRVWGINDSAQIVGYWLEIAGPDHSFVRQADGTYTIIDEPDADLSTGKGTRASAINNDGVVTGSYDDKNTGRVRAFIRDQFGNFTSFDAVAGGQDDISPFAINASGAISGSYSSSFLSIRGFVRDASGVVTTFDVTDATETDPAAMNDSGTIVGQWINRHQATAGFIRDASGNVTRFTVPVPNAGASARSVNNTGRITGSYLDNSSVNHGFVR